MGLDTTHDCWHGPYSQFMRWREYLCEVAGIPPLGLMEGYYSSDGLDCFANFDVCHGQNPFNEQAKRCLPIRWNAIDAPHALKVLLSHSDCGGSIAVEHLEPMAVVLEELASMMEDNEGVISGPYNGDGKPSARGSYDGFKAATLRFVAGLRRARDAGEPVEFH